MNWLDGLRRVDFAGKSLIGASFRGVPFFVDSSDRAGGRRTAVHQFPYRDEPFVEDLGKNATTFRVEGYVIGDDYIAQRDALLTALEETSGPGALVHPYYGRKRAICSSVTVRESPKEGRFATFSVEFSETPAQAPTPTIAVDGAGAVATSADLADAATDAELVAVFDPSGLPAFALASASAAITKAAGAMQTVLGPVVGAAQEAAALAGSVAVITAEASSLVRTPAGILGAFRAAISALSDTLLSSPGSVMSAMIDAYGFDLGTTVTGSTATRTREIANQAALTSALRRVFAIQAARLATVAAFTSSDDATNARDRIADMLDEQASLANDTGYPALVDLRSQVLSAVPGGAALARIVTVTRSVPIPSLLLAYQLYGSTDLELDLIARNKVQHPGFVAGDLKVLSNG